MERILRSTHLYTYIHAVTMTTKCYESEGEEGYVEGLREERKEMYVIKLITTKQDLTQYFPSNTPRYQILTSTPC